MSEENAAKPKPMTDEELRLIFEAVAWRVEAANKSPQDEWPDRAAVVGRMTYSAERLLGEVERQRERIRALEGAAVRDFVRWLEDNDYAICVSEEAEFPDVSRWRRTDLAYLPVDEGGVVRKWESRSDEAPEEAPA